MAESKQIDDWNHTSALITWIVRMNVGKKAKNVQPKHFHPFTHIRREQKTVMPKEEAYARLHGIMGMN